MQFDRMVQCYAGAGVYRDIPMLDSLNRETVFQGVETVLDTGLEGL